MKLAISSCSGEKEKKDKMDLLRRLLGALHASLLNFQTPR